MVIEINRIVKLIKTMLGDAFYHRFCANALFRHVYKFPPSLNSHAPKEVAANANEPPAPKDVLPENGAAYAEKLRVQYQQEYIIF